MRCLNTQILNRKKVYPALYSRQNKGHLNKLSQFKCTFGVSGMRHLKTVIQQRDTDAGGAGAG